MNNENKKEYIDLPKNNDTTIDVNISVSEFDMDECCYNNVEDFTEKVIKNLENSLIRSSYEYRNYINYLKQELDLTTCPLMPGLNVKEIPVNLEFHHYPMSLFDITVSVASALVALSDGEPVTGFDIAEQVMKEHYENNIGLIPLTSTLHEMAHNNVITIPINTINGNYVNFYNKYKDFMPLEVLERIEDNIARSTSKECIQANTEKLEKKIIYLNVDYKDKDNLTEDDFNFFE